MPIELTDDPPVQAELHERAGQMAFNAAHAEEAATHFEAAIALFDEAGETHARAARRRHALLEIMWDRGRLEEGLERMDRSYQELSLEEPDADLAGLAAQIGRFLFFAGRHDVAMERIESALDTLRGPGSARRRSRRRSIPRRSFSSPTAASSKVLRSCGMPSRWRSSTTNRRQHFAGYFNLADSLSQADRYEEAESAVRDGLAYARRVGNRYQELLFLGQSYALFALGKWEEALDWAAELPEDWMSARQAYSTVSSICVSVLVHQGNLEEAERVVTLLGDFATSADAQERAGHACGRARLLLAHGDASEALRVAQTALDMSDEMGLAQEYVKESVVTALEAALELGDAARAQQLARSHRRAPCRQSAAVLPRPIPPLPCTSRRTHG